MSVPSKAELERFFGSESAKDVRFLEAVASWPSLRILDFLYSEGASSTGDISRELNMDMREVKDRLDVLDDLGVVIKKDDEWVAETSEITLKIRNSEGIDISYSLEEGSQPSSQSKPGSDKGIDDKKQKDGPLTKLRRAIKSLIT